MFNVQRSSKSAAYFWNFVNMRTQPTFSISSKSKCNCKFSYDNSHFEMRFYFNEFCQNWVFIQLVKFILWMSLIQPKNFRTWRDSNLETETFNQTFHLLRCLTMGNLSKSKKFLQKQFYVQFVIGWLFKKKIFTTLMIFEIFKTFYNLPYLAWFVKLTLFVFKFSLGW